MPGRTYLVNRETHIRTFSAQTDFKQRSIMDASATELNSTQALGRKIRLKLLLDEGLQIENKLRHQSSVETLEEIRKIISASDDIIAEGNVEDRAENTTEVVMDAQVLKMNHELVSKVLMQIKDFNDEMYHNAIASIVFKDDDVNWEAITEIACGIAHTTRTKSTMLGAVEVHLKERVIKERQKRRKTVLTEEKRPQTVEKLKRRDKGAEKVNIVHEQLAHIFKSNNREPIPYYKLIIDPDNFINTVGNAFQMSFLARDNIIAIETGSDMYPHVRLITPEERKIEKDTTQSICTLNLKTCQEMILFYNIKEPMLTVPNSEDGDD